MAILKIAQLGHPVLRGPAQPVAPDTITSPEVQDFIDDMIDTMREYSGVGLAATQVHESVQILVVETIENSRYPETTDIALTVLVNPKITDFSMEMDEDWEGCLSLTDLWGMVKRSTSITVEAYDREGEKIKIETEGFLARVLQHEIDHLSGKLFVDRMSDLGTLSFGKERMRYSHTASETPA